MPLSPDVAAFSRLISALKPWLDQAVIVGGWAHRLYHLHPTSQRPVFAPLATLDADIALPPTLSNHPPTLRESLEMNGFEAEFRGDAMPPATLYRLTENDGGFYAEFLTPLTGGEYSRSGQRRATAQVGGVNSQQLRWIELLLADPWTVELQTADLGLPEVKVVRIANPVAFLAQKLLIHARRSAPDRAKDILYIHDTLQIFGGRLDEFHEAWVSGTRSRLHPRTARSVETAHKKLFGQLTEATRAAAKIAPERRIDPEALRETCEYGLQQVFR